MAKEIEEDVLALVREEDQSRLLYFKDWEDAELWKGAEDAEAAEVELSEPIILTPFFVKLLDGRTLSFNSDIRSSVKGLKAKIGYKIGCNVTHRGDVRAPTTPHRGDVRTPTTPPLDTTPPHRHVSITPDYPARPVVAFIKIEYYNLYF
jgi:hypothetical protein